MSRVRFDPFAGVETPPEPDRVCPECGCAVCVAGRCTGCGWPSWEECA